jgi:hypothetical protein
MEFFGWYEVVTILLILGAHLHGIYEGKKASVVTGVEMTLKMLEEQNIIKVHENGEIEPICTTVDKNS